MIPRFRNVGILLLFACVFVCDVRSSSEGSAVSEADAGAVLPQDAVEDAASQTSGNSESATLPVPVMEQEAAAEGGASGTETRDEIPMKLAEDQLPADPAGPIDRFARQFDEIPIVRSTSEKILDLTAQLDEFLQFPMFHQIVYSLGIAGTVSFTFQLLLTKLLVLLRGGFSIREIISDLTGLAFSLSVVVLTLRGGGRGTEFSGHPGMLVGLTIVGILFGVVHYRWAQQQEILAARGQHAGAKRRRSP